LVWFWLRRIAVNEGSIEDDADQPGGAWRPNLSAKALANLQQLGIEDASTTRTVRR